MTTKTSLTKTYNKAASIAAPVNVNYEQVSSDAEKVANEFMAKNPSLQAQPSQSMDSQQQPIQQKTIMDQLNEGQQKLENSRIDESVKNKISSSDNEITSPNASAPTLINHDDEPHGFDTSDKMCMLGSLATGGVIGVTDAMARAVQLLGTVGRYMPEYITHELMPAVPQGQVSELVPQIKKLSDFYAGGEKGFTDWYNRETSQNKLVKLAEHSHPIVFELGKIASNTAITAPFLEGVMALSTGAKVLPAAKEAMDVISGVAENAGGASGFANILKGASQKAAAKIVSNVNKTITPMTLAKWTGQGAMIGESQYDPENNHYIGQGMAGAAIGLATGVGGRLISGLASPLATEIANISSKYGISLPVKPSLEKISKWLPMGGYGKLMIDRAKQITGKIEQMGGEVLSANKSEIGADLSQRINKITAKLEDSGLSDYDQGKLAKQLSSLKNQQEQIATKSGLSQYLYGKTAQSLEEHKAMVSDLNNKLNESMSKTPPIELANTITASNDISKEQQGIIAGLRKPALLSISSNFIAKGDNSIKDSFVKAGIKNPEDMSVAIEDMMNGKLFRKNPQAYHLLTPYQNEIANALHFQGLPNTGVDLTDPIHNLIDKGNMSYDAFRLNRTMVGDKLASANTSIERKYYKNMYRAMSEDLNNHISKYGTPNDMFMYKEQNRIRRDIIDPLDNLVDGYSGAKDKNADTFIGRFLKPDQPNGVKDLLDLMPKGDKTSQAALKAAVLHEAHERAFVPGVGINPTKWINEVQKLGETNKVLFSENEQEAFEGFHKLINIVQKISPDALEAGVETGLTGKEATSKLFKEKSIKSVEYMGLGALGLKLGAGALVPILMAGASFGKLMTSQTGRNLMSRMAKLGADAKNNEVNPVVRDVFKYLGFYPMAAGAAKIESSGND